MSLASRNRVLVPEDRPRDAEVDRHQLITALEKIELAVRRTETAVAATDIKLGYLMGALGDEIAKVISD
jgi:hypothetical protein